ncbi:hypothetical protein KRR26_12160 [Corallococcus sp. M34]|uniref:hypothetical protein n=1 Tax=Citreicoccus inhibens TaxID=2849499 RepID=UPI001C223AC5|nr:hypothetical protein [Citreicoccus inhibens]MBU8896366.1 hypothetical protein [Citreicoccus inhibens]
MSSLLRGTTSPRRRCRAPPDTDDASPPHPSALPVTARLTPQPSALPARDNALSALRVTRMLHRLPRVGGSRFPLTMVLCQKPATFEPPNSARQSVTRT